MATAYQCDRCSMLFEKAQLMSLSDEYCEMPGPFEIGGQQNFRVRWTLKVVEDTADRHEPDLCDSCRSFVLAEIAKMVTE